MKKSILMITGWGGGVQLLQPLQQALQEKGYAVELINIFNAFDHEVFAKHIARAKQSDAIVGWSLGGQLAALLADAVTKQTGEMKPLITMASNPCFVATKHWPYAMPPQDFEQFITAFDQDMVATLKRFGLLVTQGAVRSKADFLYMQSLVQAQSVSLLKQGLKLLNELNLVEILSKYKGKQLHLFGEHDALVPSQVRQKIAQITTKKCSTLELSGAAHSFPFIQVKQTCDEIDKFLTY